MGMFINNNQKETQKEIAQQNSKYCSGTLTFVIKCGPVRSYNFIYSNKQIFQFNPLRS